MRLVLLRLKAQKKYIVVHMKEKRKKTEEEKTAELIEHWMWRAHAVFTAEDVVQLRDEWREKLNEAKLKKMSPEDRDQLARDYLYAIAKEIVMHADDEE